MTDLPRIQYVTTSDGVSIAYYTLGQGPAVLVSMLPFSHLEAEWQVDSLRTTFLVTARAGTLIRLDHRGFGLSDRVVDDYSVDGLVRDIEAVVEALGIDDLRIYAVGLACIPALAYTARHPDVVARLIQGSASARYEDTTNARIEKIMELAEVDWALTCETMMRTLQPDAPEEFIREFARLVMASTDPETFRRGHDSFRGWNVDDEARKVTTPTLLIHRKNQNNDVAVTRRVAGLIRTSRVAFVESDFEGVQLAASFFFGAEPAVHGPRADHVQQARAEDSTLRTVLFTDLVGHTEMMSRLGDEKGREVLREHERITREVLKAHGGTEVKTMGDGFMASFAGVTKAVECAVAMQREMGNVKWGNGEQMKVRIGLNAGEPIEEEGDLFGATVILASRIAAKAEGGEILVADTVRGLCSGKGFLFADRGEFVAKGFEEPVRVYEVRWRE